MLDTTTRNANLTDLAAMLRDQRARSLDVVANAAHFAIDPRTALLHVQGTEPQLSEDGVTMTAGTYRPTSVFDEGAAAKLGIPVGYLRRLRESRPDLYAANVNGWLHGSRVLRRANGEQEQAYGPDARSFMLRLFKGDEGQPGIARAMLSDSYKVIDNLDVLMSALDGVREAGIEVDVHSCDLTDRRMHIRLHAPEVRAYAPTLLRGYRSPFSGDSGDANPTVFAGFRITNSEVGDGAFSITPELRVQVCSNGMTITRDVMRNVHLGGKLDAGVIRWSEETQQRAVALVRSQTADAVRTFLDVDYVTRTIAALEQRAEEPVNGIEGVKVLTKALKFADADLDGMLDHFVRGGQMNRAGVANAITSYSQTLDDADSAARLDEQAYAVLTA